MATTHSDGLVMQDNSNETSKHRLKRSKSKGNKFVQRQTRIGNLVRRRLLVREQRKIDLALSFEDGNTIKDILARAKCPIAGVKMKDIRRSGQIYTDCFRGKNFVSWLVLNDYAQTKKQAVNLGNNLLKRGIINHVTGEHDFRNKIYYYYFTDQDIEEEIHMFKDKHAEKEWKTRKLCEKDVDLTMKLISPNLTLFTWEEFFDAPHEWFYNFFPLCISFIRNVGRSGELSTMDFVKFVLIKPHLLQYRRIRTFTLLLLSNPEFTSFWKCAQIYHDEIIMTDRTKSYLKSILGNPPDDDNKCWTQMSAIDIECELVRTATYIAHSQEAQEKKVIQDVEGVILVDTKDLQTQEVLISRLNSTPLQKGTVLCTEAIQHPLIANYNVTTPTRITVEKIYNTNARPALLSFKQIQKGTFITDDAWEEVKPRVIWKQGDNLNQDMGISLAFKVFNVIWAENSKLFPTVKDRPYIKTYQVFPTGFTPEGLRAGFIEVVDSAESLKTFNWQDWSDRVNEDMVTRFITSAAGAYIGGYVLGVRDRHWDNILIRNKDTLLHIDFGFVLGIQPPIDAPIFSISTDMKIALTKLNVWDKFIDLLLCAYKALRLKSKEVIQAAKLIFGVVLEWGPDVIENFMIESLQLNVDEEVALNKIKNEIEGSSVAWQNFFKQLSHKTIDPVWYGLLRRHFPPAVMIRSQLENSSKTKLGAKKDKDFEGEHLSLLSKECVVCSSTITPCDTVHGTKHILSAPELENRNKEETSSTDDEEKEKHGKIHHRKHKKRRRPSSYN